MKQPKSEEKKQLEDEVKYVDVLNKTMAFMGLPYRYAVGIAKKDVREHQLLTTDDVELSAHDDV